MAIVGTAGAFGGLVGFGSGVSQEGTLIGRILLALIQGAVGALLLGLVALLALAIGTAVWGLLCKVAGR